jgi:hypothetical protein
MVGLRWARDGTGCCETYRRDASLLIRADSLPTTLPGDREAVVSMLVGPGVAQLRDKEPNTGRMAFSIAAEKGDVEVRVQSPYSPHRSSPTHLHVHVSIAAVRSGSWGSGAQRAAATADSRLRVGCTAAPDTRNSLKPQRCALGLQMLKLLVERVEQEDAEQLRPSAVNVLCIHTLPRVKLSPKEVSSATILAFTSPLDTHASVQPCRLRP